MPAIQTQTIQTLPLRGVTAAAYPALTGPTVFESEVPFRLRSLRSAPGVLTQRVTRANGTGLLTFAYQIALTETDYDADLHLAASFSLHGLLVTFADFRVDGPGVKPPTTVSSMREGWSFLFSYGLAAGRPTRFCILSTNAREFKDHGGAVRLVTGSKAITLDVASPVAVVATRSAGFAELQNRTAGHDSPPVADGEISEGPVPSDATQALNR